MPGNPVSVKVEGLAELRRALLQLPKELHAGPLRSAVSAGAKVVQDRAIELAPEDTGTLKRAIYRTRSQQGSSGVQEMQIVGVRSGKQFRAKKEKKGNAAKNRDAWYWSFLEFGTSHAAAKPFLRPAFDTTHEAQIEAIRIKLKAAIERAAEKLAEKTKGLK